MRARKIILAFLATQQNHGMNLLQRPCEAAPRQVALPIKKSWNQ
jgi:hypothetical protein